MIGFKKKPRLKLIVILMACALSAPSAYAGFGGGPQYDPSRWAQSVWDNIQKAQKFVQTEVIEKYKIAARYQQVKDEIDTYNNGFANWIARVDGSLEELGILDQESRARPIQDACRVIGVQELANQADCAEDDISELVNSTSESITSFITDFGNKVKSSVGLASAASPFATGNVAAGSSGLPPSEKQQAEKDLEKFYKRLEDAVTRNDRWIKEGKNPNNPTLLLLTETQAPVYTDEELLMAVNTADITYPEFQPRSNTDPLNEREVAYNVRVKNAIGMNNKVVYDQIAERTAPADGKPSRLMAMMMPVQVKLSNDGALDTTGESWIHKIALNEGTTPAENSKESLLMTALEVQQALFSYKAQLIREQLILSAYTGMVDPFER
jgi:hypothetical protein